MSLRVVQAVAETERNDDFHLGRLMVLLRSADLRKTKVSTKAKAVEGIMKLAKLDFLLRYPTCLERALIALGKDAAIARVQPRERTSIETTMIRFRYGPWDARYRRWLGLLTARGVVSLELDGNTIEIGLTERGRHLADRIRQDSLFRDLSMRSDAIIGFAGGMSGTKLKAFIYETIPEILDMRWGDEIKFDSE
jgi:hypothetical protein